jgi:hypothetical protein
MAGTMHDTVFWEDEMQSDRIVMAFQKNFLLESQTTLMRVFASEKLVKLSPDYAIS